MRDELSVIQRELECQSGVARFREISHAAVVKRE